MGETPKSETIPAPIRFVLDPISVVIPPSILTYERGSSVLLISILLFSTRAAIKGINITTIGVLFITELRIATKTKIMENRTIVFSLFSNSNIFAIELIAPVATIPSAIISRAITVINPGFAKPDNKFVISNPECLENIICINAKLDNNPIETVSIGYLSKIKKNRAIMPTIIVNNATIFKSIIIVLLY